MHHKTRILRGAIIGVGLTALAGCVPSGGSTGSSSLGSYIDSLLASSGTSTSVNSTTNSDGTTTTTVGLTDSGTTSSGSTTTTSGSGTTTTSGGTTSSSGSTTTTSGGTTSSSGSTTTTSGGTTSTSGSTTTTSGGTTSTSSGTTTQTSSATLSWVAPTQRTDGTALGPNDLTGYNIYYGPSTNPKANEVKVSGGLTTQYTVTGLAPNTYTFTVTAVDSMGDESAPSNAVTKTAG